MKYKIEITSDAPVKVYESLGKLLAVIDQMVSKREGDLQNMTNMWNNIDVGQDCYSFSFSRNGNAFDLMFEDK